MLNIRGQTNFRFLEKNMCIKKTYGILNNKLKLINGFVICFMIFKKVFYVSKSELFYVKINYSVSKFPIYRNIKNDIL